MLSSLILSLALVGGNPPTDKTDFKIVGNPPPVVQTLSLDDFRIVAIPEPKVIIKEVIKEVPVEKVIVKEVPAEQPRQVRRKPVQQVVPQSYYTPVPVMTVPQTYSANPYPGMYGSFMGGACVTTPLGRQ